MKWLITAADQGHLEAQKVLCYLYENDYEKYGVKDLAQAVRWNRVVAERGDLGAIHSMAKFYEWGRGVAEDGNEAIKWYKRAIEQGDLSAMYLLAMLYTDGCKGVSKDGARATKWLEKAADNGDLSSMHTLAFRYQYGEQGTPEDYVLAYKWNNIWFSKIDEDDPLQTGTDNIEEQKKWFENFKKRMSKDQIAEGQKMSREWLAKRQE